MTEQEINLLKHEHAQMKAELDSVRTALSLGREEHPGALDEHVGSWIDRALVAEEKLKEPGIALSKIIEAVTDGYELRICRRQGKIYIQLKSNFSVTLSHLPLDCSSSDMAESIVQLHEDFTMHDIFNH